MCGTSVSESDFGPNGCVDTLPTELRQALFQGVNSGSHELNPRSQWSFQDGQGSYPVHQKLYSSGRTLNKLLDTSPKEVKGQYPCVLCNRSYQRHYSLARHMLTHQGSGKHFSCPLCQTRFTQKPTLKTHLRAIHSAAQCRVCEKVLPLGEEFDKHVMQCLSSGSEWTEMTRLLSHSQPKDC